jgi:hypothetical protein
MGNLKRRNSRLKRYTLKGCEELILGYLKKKDAEVAQVIFRF